MDISHDQNLIQKTGWLITERVVFILVAMVVFQHWICLMHLMVAERFANVLILQCSDFALKQFLQFDNVTFS